MILLRWWGTGEQISIEIKGFCSFLDCMVCI